ncbi:sigma factor [Paenarthrobacter ureafaciens]
MSAFDHLYERHISIAAAVARRNVDNPSDAEDVVAEAFQAVLQKPGRRERAQQLLPGLSPVHRHEAVPPPQPQSGKHPAQ